MLHTLLFGPHKHDKEDSDGKYDKHDGDDEDDDDSTIYYEGLSFHM